MSARVFASHELAARVWWDLSAFRGERALAARRFRETAPACADEDVRLQVVGVLALEGFHAKGITAAVVRDRAAVIAAAYPDEAMAQRVREIVAATARALRIAS